MNTRVQKFENGHICQHDNFIQDWQYGASVHVVKNVRIDSRIWQPWWELYLT